MNLRESLLNMTSKDKDIIFGEKYDPTRSRKVNRPNITRALMFYECHDSENSVMQNDYLRMLSMTRKNNSSVERFLLAGGGQDEMLDGKKKAAEGAATWEVHKPYSQGF